MNLRDLVPAQQYQARAWFDYNVGLAANTTLAPSLSQNANFQVDKDADFFWTKLTVHAVAGADGTTVSAVLMPEVNVLITNTSSGRAFMNEAVPLANLAGTDAGLPFILPMETYIPAVSMIQVQFFNVSDNTTYSLLELSFIGYKAFL